MVAVLTGDIVGSSSLSPEDHRKVLKVVKSMAMVFPDAVVGEVDVFSGDSWQMLVSDCGLSLRIALYLRASLKREKGLAVDSRVSMAWGEIDMGHVDRTRMSESTGALFTLSGRGLAGLKKTASMGFAALDDDVLSAAVGSSLGLIDALVREWSPEQARAVAESLRGRTQAEIAAEFGVGQSSINKSLQAAHWIEIADALLLLDQLINNHPIG